MLSFDKPKVSVLGRVLVCHHCFARFPNELPFPPTASDKRRYVQSLLTDDEEDVVAVLRKQINDYKVRTFESET